jgi:hypothetical protein
MGAHHKESHDAHNCKKHTHQRSSSSSSEEITIKINLKKALEKSKKKKHRTINICPQEDSEEDFIPAKPSKIKPKVEVVEKPKVMTPVKDQSLERPAKQPEQKPLPKEEKLIPPVVEEKKPQQPAAPAEVAPLKEKVPEPEPAATNLLPALSEGAGNALSSLGLGIKVVQSSKTVTVKPKPAKSAADLDPRLNEFAVAITNKNVTPELKDAAIKKLHDSSIGMDFVKVGLTDKGREEQLADLDKHLQSVKASALKLYIIENETHTIVGGLHWDTQASLAKLNPELFKLTTLNLANPEDEKEVIKTLKNCLKNKLAE